jgi:hypothetical protein
MPPWQRTYLVACALVTGFAVAYALCDYASWPRLIYAPVDGSLRLDEPPIGRDEVGYLGMVAWGAGGALLGGLAAFAAARAIRGPLPARWLRLAGAWALTAVLLTGAFHTWSLWPF